MSRKLQTLNSQNIEESLTYCDFPYEHWTWIRINNVIEHVNSRDPAQNKGGRLFSKR